MKLSNEKRGDILNNIIEGLYPKEDKDAMIKEIGDSIVSDIRKGLKQGWEDFVEYINTADRVCVRTESNGSIYFDSNLKYPAYLKNNWDRMCYLSIGELSKNNILKVEKYCDLLEELEEKKSVFKAVLDSVNTVEQLIKTLPEIEKYIPEFPENKSVIAVETLEKAKRALLK